MSILPLLLLLISPQCLVASKHYPERVQVASIERLNSGEVLLTLKFPKNATPVDVVSVFCIYK